MASKPAGDQFPAGVVTFLLTDIEGSTRHWEQDPKAMANSLAVHDSLMAEEIQSHHGRLIKARGEGDSVFAVFDTATGALEAALNLQKRLNAHRWPGSAIRVRIALHTGEAETRGGDYYGPTVIRAARLRDIAHGGQILASGEVREAARELEGVTLRDLGTHRIKDMTRPIRVFQVCHRDLRADFPPLRSALTLRHNLPMQLTTFVGREREMREVLSLLVGARLVTLTGVGGSGKTRLALRVAAEVVDDHPDGVWFCDLAALSDPAQVTRAIGDAVGTRTEGALIAPGRPAGVAGGEIENLAAHLSMKKILLLLDNAEHLVDPAAHAAEGLLRACPDLKVLVTSREPLGVTGETTYSVAPLETPQVSPTASAAAIADNESVRLFVDRAGAARSDFQLTDSNAGWIAEITTRLDGIPLAIELAASRISILSPEQIASRLDDRFRILASLKRGEDRHRTLEAAIDWSYDMLDEDEKTLLRRLSVFAGRFSFEAVEQVCFEPALETDLLQLLASLVSRSLVVADPFGSELLYRLLETIRVYAGRKLDAEDDSLLRDRHRDWYLALSEMAGPQMLGSDANRWLDRLEAESDNLRAAIERSFADGGEIALRICVASWPFWWIRGHASEGRNLLARALESTALATGEAMCAALFAASFLALAQGDLDSARSLAAKCLDVSRDPGYERWVAGADLVLATAARIVRDDEAARSLAERALESARSAGDGFVTSLALSELGILAHAHRKDDEARRLLAEARSVAKGAGNQVTEGRALHFIASVAHNLGDYESSRKTIDEALGIAQEIGDRFGEATLLQSLALGGHAQMRFGEAEGYLRQSLDIWRELGAAPTVAWSLERLGFFLVMQNKSAAARAPLEEALELRKRMSDKAGEASTLNALGWAAYLDGDYARARPLLQEGLAIARELEAADLVPQTLHSLGEVARAQGDLEFAESTHTEGLGLVRQLGERQGIAYAAHGLGEIARARGDHAAALGFHREALMIRVDLGDTPRIADSLEALAGLSSDRGQNEAAARLFGAAEGVRSADDVPRTIHAQEVFERDHAATKQVLGDQAFTDLAAVGKKTSLEEVLKGIESEGAS